MSIQHRVGEVRPNQVMHTYGIGAIIDLPSIAALVLGLDEWPGEQVCTQISEPRLLQVVRWQLGDQVTQLRLPPARPETSGSFDPFDEDARVGIPVTPFPSWMLCPQCRIIAPLSSGLFTLKPDAYHPDRTRFVHNNCREFTNPTVVPARFLTACPNGHLDDFPWFEFAHHGSAACRAPLKLIERRPSGELSDLMIICEGCDNRRLLREAFGPIGHANMPTCRGRRPHLRDFDHRGCTEKARAILLGASNLWFPEILSTLAIPNRQGRLRQLVEDHWVKLRVITDPNGVVMARAFGLLGAFASFTDDQIWEAIQRQQAAEQNAGAAEAIDLKQTEWEVLSDPTNAPSSDDFRVREVAAPNGFADRIARVTLVERLREVKAMIGFTRIEAPEGLADATGNNDVHRMPLRDGPPTWVPATEVRGEGIFIQLDEAELQAWLARPEVREQNDRFYEAHRRWRKARKIVPPEAHYPGMRYVLLHSFAHVLLRQLAIECGYTAASVRERIYARDPGADPNHPAPLAGLLIYTGAPDSEGTLGGLVSLGEPAELGRLISAALRQAQRCTADPLCAERQPSSDGLTVHAAACHSCLQSPETSCERGNKYLDRATLAPTVEREGLAFFPTVGA